MLINDLEHLQEVCEENQIQGGSGIQLGSVSSTTANGVNTDSGTNMYVNASSGGSANSGSRYFYGESGPSTYSSAGGSVSFSQPYYYPYPYPYGRY